MLLRRTTGAPALVTVLLSLAACGGPMTTDAGDAHPADTTGDRAVTETGTDTGTPDMGKPDMGTPDMGAPDMGTPDMGAPDSGPDAAPDMGTPDVGPDATPDMGTPDAGPEAGLDAAPDAGPEAGPDAAPDVRDAGPCPTPVRALTLPSDTYSGTLAGTSRNPSTSCASTSGPDDYFTLNVTTRTGVVLSTIDPATTVDTVLAVRTACNDSMSEVACNDDAPVSGAGTQSFIRSVLEPGTYTVLVDQYGAGGTPTGGPYHLSLTSFTPAANAVCGGAAALTAGTMVSGDTTNGGAPITYCLSGSNGAPLYYQLSIPSGQRATITATPSTMTGRAVVRVLDSCAATTCSSSGSSASAGAAATATALNTGATARTVIVAVSGNDISTPLSFSLLATLSPVASNADCSTPQTVTPGTMLSGVSTAMGGLPSTVCLTGDSGAQLYYSVTVPANNRATITATPTAMTDRATVRVLDACPATLCTTSSRSASAGAAATVSFVNSDTTPHTYIFSVSGTTSAPITFDLLATLTVLAANASCSGAVALTPGTSVMGNTTSGGAAATTCLTGSNGAQLYYSLSIPAAQRATITATGMSGQVALRVLDTCASTGCVTSASSSGAGMMASVTVNNTGTTARNVIVSVSSTSTTPATFTLLATLGALPYSVTTFSGATCDTLTAAATTLSGATMDDSVSPNTALPFTFTFFRTMYGYFTATSNGFMQLFPDATGAGVTNYINDPIPTASDPNSLIAPFWDDLVPDGAPGGVIRTQVFGTAPSRHFTVEWTGWHPFTTTGTSLTFQAKLYETTNVIEFTYCSLTPATDARVTGNSATIGIENATGTDGVQFSNNTAMAVSTSTGVRFTPAP